MAFLKFQLKNKIVVEILRNFPKLIKLIYIVVGL